MKNSITTRGMDIGSTRLAAEPVRRHSGLLGRIASFTRGVRSGVLALGLSAGAVSTLASCVPGEVGLQAAVAQPDLTKNTPADAGADLSGTKDATMTTPDGGDMSMMEDAVMTLDAQEGDMTGESDMADNDASVNTDGGEVDMPNNDGGVQADGNVTDGGVDAGHDGGSTDAGVQDGAVVVQDGGNLDGSRFDLNGSDLVAPADLAEKPDQAIASILDVTGTGCKKVFVFDKQTNNVKFALGGDDGVCENNAHDEVTVDFAKESVYVWEFKPNDNELTARWLGDPLNPPNSFGMYTSIPGVMPKPAPWAPKSVDVETALKNAAFNGLGNLAVLPDINLKFVVIGFGRGYTIGK